MKFVMRIPPQDGHEKQTCHVNIQFLGVKLPKEEALQVKASNPELFEPKTNRSCQIQ